MTRIVELSHHIVSGDAGYPGLPAPHVRPHLSHAAAAGRYADGATFEITHVSMVGNTGTYLDSPAHRFPGRTDVAGIPLTHLVDLRAIVVDAPLDGPVAVEFEVTTDMRGAAVLIRTGWDAHRGNGHYFTPAPYLASSTAAALARAGCALVGVDTWNVDDTRSTARPVHTALLDAGVIVVEHLARLQHLPGTGARFTAAPLAVVGAASMPVRAWATVPA
jgi:arylformamidase